MRPSILRAFVADRRSVRALEETWLDIEAEGVGARDRMSRTRWIFRSSVALARVGIRISFFETGALVSSGWLIRVLCWSFLFTGLLMVPPLLSLEGSMPGNVYPVLLVSLVPQALCVGVPLSAFFATLWPARGSTAPIAIQGSVAALLVLGALLVTPPANQTFRDVAYAAYAATTEQRVSKDALRPGFAEMSLIELAREGFLPPSSAAPFWPPRGARRQFLSETGLIGAATALSVLGAVVSHRRARRWPFAISVPVASCILVAAGAPVGLGTWTVAAAALFLASCVPRTKPSRR